MTASSEYLAGFVDGEGHLSLGKIPRRSRSTEYPVRLVVYNSDLRALRAIQEDWGGTIFDAGSRNPRWKPELSLIWTDAAAVDVLTKVAPFLRVKSRQAEELLKYSEHVRKCRRVRDRSGRLLPLDRRELRFREERHALLKRLNARGPPDGTPLVPIPGASVGGPSSEQEPSAEYLAGIMDAEGSLMIAKSKDRGSPNPHYRARMSLSNTCRSVLEDVAHTFGGIITDQPPPNPNWKHSYQLIWTSGMVENLLASIMPHLRLKREQAAILTSLVHHMKTTRRTRRAPDGRFAAPYPGEVMAFREGLYKRIRALNAKGPSAPVSTRS